MDKVSMGQIRIKLVEQEREIAMCRTRLSAEQMKLADMNLELAKVLLEAEGKKEETNK